MGKICQLKEEINEILKLCDPIMQYLDEHYDPYTKVVIDMDGVKVLETGLSIPRVQRPESV